MPIELFSSISEFLRFLRIKIPSRKKYQEVWHSQNMILISDVPINILDGKGNRILFIFHDSIQGFLFSILCLDLNGNDLVFEPNQEIKFDGGITAAIKT